MFAASTIIAGVGAAVAVGGAVENYLGTKATAKANAAAAQTQGQIAQLQAGNVDVQQQELQLQSQQSDLQIATNKSVINQQQAAADITQQAASLDATRRIRQAIRNGVVASGTSLNMAADSGAAQPGSTGVRQARANIQGETNNNVTGVAQNSEAGTAVYNINKGITQTYLAAQDANAAYVDKSTQLQSQALSTQKQIYALGGQASNDYASAALAQGTAATGAGLLNLGGSVASNYNNINKLTSYFGAQNNPVLSGGSLTQGWFQ